MRQQWQSGLMALPYGQEAVTIPGLTLRKALNQGFHLQYSATFVVSYKHCNEGSDLIFTKEQERRLQSALCFIMRNLGRNTRINLWIDRVYSSREKHRNADWIHHATEAFANSRVIVLDYFDQRIDNIGDISAWMMIQQKFGANGHGLVIASENERVNFVKNSGGDVQEMTDICREVLSSIRKDKDLGHFTDEDLDSVIEYLTSRTKSFRAVLRSAITRNKR